ncbi:MAG: M23 family metallopeptidase [Ruminococcaceae bacterium]|nr:M23 family metallopeptidase [Oscillospiraceae bacterium]
MPDASVPTGTQALPDTQPSQEPQPSLPTSAPTTAPPTTAPTTAPTTVPTIAPTSPPATQPPTQKPNSSNPKVIAFVDEKMSSWTSPMRVEFGEVIGSRTFASSRGGGKRAHAGLDFVAPHGTKVYAITAGVVQRVAMFYQNTWAVEVKNDDGSILRYCEISTDLEVGDKVSQGDLVGTVLRADSGTEMLHMEVYYGDSEGSLTQTGNKSYQYIDEPKNFLRRSDLLDPTFLKDLPVK